MAKKCKHCGAVVEDGIFPCPKCDNIAFVEFPKMELTRDQLAEIEKSIAEKLGKSSNLAWRLTWRVVLVIFTMLGIPGAIVGWSIWSSMQNFEQTANKDIQNKFTALTVNVSNRIENAHIAISSDVALKFSVYAQEASNQLAEAHAFVTNQIAAEFQTPRIKQTVESVAKGEAKSILEAEVQPAVTSFKEDALFMRTIARAQGYDFKAYQRLLEIGTETNDNARLANQVIAEIDRSLGRDRSDFSPRRRYVFVSGTNFYEGPFASDELAIRFSHVAQDQTPFNREGFINSVGGLKQPLFLSRLIEFFTNEVGLAVADRATIAISDLAKEEFHPRDFPKIVAWWNDNHDSYTNWPFSNFDYGLRALLRDDFGVAAKSFQEVVDVDPSADMSRALAIKSYCEIGATNKATELSQSFRDPAGRWAKWGGAFIELENGGISNATVKFFELSRTGQTMLVGPQEGTHFWGKLDWPLFHKLNSTKKP